MSIKTIGLAIGYFFAINTGQAFDLKKGDLLFQDIDCGEFCSSIEKVTEGYKGSDFSHVGWVYSVEDSVVIIEAVSEGVVFTTFEDFMKRSSDSLGNPKVVVGRLKPEFRENIDSALEYSASLLHKQYDFTFDLENDRYYCSEIISFALAKSCRSEVFYPEPMTYTDPETGEIFPAWKEYFEQLGIPVPEGKPGLNPGAMSRSGNIEIVHFYGFPDGYKK